MARDLDGSGDYLTVVSAPLNETGPFTAALWFNADVDTELDVIWYQGEDTVFNGYDIAIRGDLGGDPIAFTAATGSQENAITSNGFTAGTWHHACAIVTSVTNRRVILDGNWASSGTDTVSITPTNADTTRLGRPGHSSGVDFDGQVAWCAEWTAALVQWEVEALAAGAHPLLIRPASLVVVWPLSGGSPDRSLVGDLDLTVSGTPGTVADPAEINFPRALPVISSFVSSAVNPLALIRSMRTAYPAFGSQGG